MPRMRLTVHDSAHGIEATAWDTLLAQQPRPTPFLRHAYLAAMTDSGSATPDTGWTPRFFALWQPQATGAPVLAAACVLYLKTHSYGEYVFDHAWAHAYRQHGVAYYPKAVIAPPFTPVPGARLLACDAKARAALLQGVLDWCTEHSISSLHLLFADDADLDACEQAGLMVRHNVQFHWSNRHGTPYSGFDDFLASLSQEKRKKIRQERRKVAEAGVEFRWAQGKDIGSQDWDFFYRCYERTYYEHGNAPYLSRDFFARMAATMPQNWLIFVGERAGQPIACSLIGLNDPGTGGGVDRIAYGRYWGALERVDCLHFEACYYQPLAWCIQQGYHRFEGGAQGEHKMARALLPVPTRSAHWLAHPAFARAVEDFLEREGRGVERYLHELEQHSPFKATGPAAAPG
jgi:predicted N-acyltransferase